MPSFVQLLVCIACLTLHAECRNGAQKLLGVLITIGEAVAYVVSGMYGDVRELGTLPAVLIILQVRIAALASGDESSPFREKGATLAAERIGCCGLAVCRSRGGQGYYWHPDSLLRVHASLAAALDECLGDQAATMLLCCCLATLQT